MTEEGLQNFLAKLSTFKQRCENFNHIYNTDIESWITSSRQKKSLTSSIGLGEEVTKVVAMHTNINNLLENFRMMHNAFNNISASNVHEVMMEREGGEKILFSEESFIHELEDSILVLQKTLTRWQQQSN